MIYVFLADGFEEIEALCPLNLMRRAGLPVATVGVGGKKEISGAHGIKVIADIKDSELCDGDPTLIMLPGGMPGTKNLQASKIVKAAIKNAAQKNAPIAAICAAPSILGSMGLLSGKRATCFPGFEGQLEGAILSEKKVVRDGNIITAAGMGVALEFGLAIIEMLLGADRAEQLARDVLAK